MLKNIIENWKSNSDKMIRKSIFEVRYRLSHDSKNQLLFPHFYISSQQHF